MAVKSKSSQDMVIDYTTDYARYVLTSRAIPSLMDGFKPVQRRVLVSARDMKLWSRGSTIKSAKVCGEVVGNYHPHGVDSVYGSLVNSTQDFKSRYPLFIGQGNWGCADMPGSVAAMRYTEVKLSPFAEDFYLSEAEYGDYEENYDGRLQELVLMYPVLPGSLLTGNSGIAIGISTNLPAHSIKDVGNSLLKYLEDPTKEDYLDHIMPETCEGSIILTPHSEIKEMYKTGQGSIRYGAKFHYETVDGKSALVVDSFPPEFSRKRLETPAVLDAVEKGKLELINESTESVRYVFISDDVNVLKSMEERLYSTVSYRFFIEHRGVIKKYPLGEIYETFVKEREQFIVRKYTDLLAKTKYELSYLDVLLKLKANKQYIKDMFDKDSDVVKAELIQMYGIDDKIANRILSASIRSLMKDNEQQIRDQIADLQSKVQQYNDYVSDPRKKMVDEITQILDDYKDDENKAIHQSAKSVVSQLTYKGATLQVDEYKEYVVGTPDNTIQKMVGIELVKKPQSEIDDYVAILPANHQFYVAYDCRGICGMTREVLLGSGNKFKSDSLVGLIGTDDLKSIEMTLGNGKKQKLGDWCLRSRASWQRMAEDTQPRIQIG